MNLPWSWNEKDGTFTVIVGTSYYNMVTGDRGNAGGNIELILGK
jgi:hypothetical protein